MFFENGQNSLLDTLTFFPDYLSYPSPPILIAHPSPRKSIGFTYIPPYPPLLWRDREGLHPGFPDIAFTAAGLVRSYDPAAS